MAETASTFYSFHHPKITKPHALWKTESREGVAPSEASLGKQPVSLNEPSAPSSPALLYPAGALVCATATIVIDGDTSMNHARSDACSDACSLSPSSKDDMCVMTPVGRYLVY